MTERSEITTIIQKELMHAPAVFGTLQMGSLHEPAIEKRSVHHFFKDVSGAPLRRPTWYFDTARQGEGIVDVTTHLVDLVMWSSFPEVPIDANRDVRVLAARRWPTLISTSQFGAVTGLRPRAPCFACTIGKGSIQKRACQAATIDASPSLR